MKFYFYLLLSVIYLNNAVASDCSSTFQNNYSQNEIIKTNHTFNGYEGIGVSRKVKTNDSLEQLISSAKIKAVDDLVQSISVSVESETKISEKVNDGNFQSTFINTTQLKSSGTFEEIKTVGYWFDNKSCNLWLKVNISKEKANLAILNIKLTSITDGFTSSTLLLGQLNELELLIDLILLNKADKVFFNNKFENVSAVIKEQVEAQKTFLDNHTKLSGIQSLSRGKRIRAYRSFAESNRELLPIFIGNTYGVPLLEDILKDISFLYIQQGEFCKGQSFLDNFLQLKSKAWYTKDKNTFSQSCSVEDITFEKELAGAIVLIECNIVLDNKRQEWGKACSEFSEYFFAQDAIPVFKSKKEIHQPDFMVKVSAIGNIEVNSEHLKKRFNGEVTVQLKDDYSIILSDVFSGFTGWSQYPNTIILDMLAINIFKRFDKKISKK